MLSKSRWASERIGCEMYSGKNRIGVEKRGFYAGEFNWQWNTNNPA